MSLRLFCLSLVVLLAGVPPTFAQLNKPDSKPNIVFICLDDLTQKYVGAFGNKVVQTPNIDGLAARGVVFENAICQGCMCAPSRNSTITAKYPHNLGLYSNGDIKMLPKDQWCFPTALQQAGYRTSWIGKSHLLPNTDGFEGRAGEKKTASMKQLMGFHEVWQSSGRHVAHKKANQQLERGGKWRRGIDAYADHLYDRGLVEKFVKEGASATTLSMDDYLDGFIARKSAKWIADYSQDEPFFLWVNFSGPHGPYNPPQKYLDLYKPDQFPPPIPTDGADVPAAMLTHPWKKNAKATALQRAQYAGMITFMDEQVGLVLDAIKSKGIQDDTVVVFYSDHGIMEGDHGLNHKETLYKEVLQSSLVIAGPGCKAGTRVRQPVELLDLGRTAMDFAEVPQEQRTPAFGHTLRIFLNGAPYGPSTGKSWLSIAEINGATAVVTLNHKAIIPTEGPIGVLFDRRSDPDELVDAKDAAFVQRSDGEKSFIYSTLSKNLIGWRSRHGPIRKPSVAGSREK